MGLLRDRGARRARRRGTETCCVGPTVSAYQSTLTVSCVHSFPTLVIFRVSSLELRHLSWVYFGVSRLG